MISTSPIKISCVIPADRVSDAVNALHWAFELGAGAVRPEDPPGPTTDPRSPVSAGHTRMMSATATASVSSARPARRLDDPGPARERASRSPRSCRWPRALGRQRAAYRSEVDVRAVAGLDPGPGPGPLLCRRLGQRRVGAEAGRGRRRRSRQHQLLADARRRPARRRRGQPGGGRRAQRDHRQPQLLDDADDGGAEAAPRRGGDRAPGDLHLPGRLRHRQAGDRRAAASRRTRSSTDEPARPRSTRTRSPSTSCPRPAASRTATTTPTRSAS